MKHNRIIRLATTAGATLAMCSAGVAYGQDAASAESVSLLEEIVVTARKREETIDKVPISIAVVSGNRLAAEGVVTLDEAMQSMPGVSVTPTPVGDLLFIRGVGSGENQGFEMSVATFIDGVHFGRGRSSRHSFLDVDRIEVLKGPQSIMFGKNTIGGAFNITTRKPTDELEVSLQAYVEPEFDTYQTTGVISGPLSDTFKGRLVVRSDITDGYVDNDFTGKSEPQRDDWVVRAIGVWSPTENLDVTFKGEYGENDFKGGRSQISRAAPQLRQLVLPIDPRAEFDLDYHKSGPGVSAPFNKEFESSTTYNGSIAIDWQVGGHTVTSLSSYVGYDLEYAFDSDFTPLDLVHQLWDQKWSTWAQELRVNSPTGRTFEYTAGVYYAKEKFENDKIFAFNFSQTGLPFGSAYRVMFFDQDTTTWSAFAQGTWNVTDRLALIAGVRHTDDEKKMNKDFYWANFGSMVPNPALTVFSQIGLGQAHRYDNIKRSTDNDSFAFTIQYRPGDTMLYATYSQGFKAGGFDEGNATGLLSDIIFDDEKAKSYEAGIKIRGLQDRLRANAAIFYSEYENLQVSMFDGVASLIVGNAAESTSKGVELDAQFAATEHLSLSASVTYLDAAYDSYPAGPCAYGQGQVCDLSGKTLPYAPEWSGNLSARWEDTLANGWTYGLRAEAVYSDMFYTAGDLDPFVAQRAYWKYDASVSLTSPSGAWEFAIMGKNLTDEVTAHFGDDIPLSNVLGNNYQQYVDPPRTIALQVRYQLR
jgi:iron complex outermembrane receptor protein